MKKFKDGVKNLDMMDISLTKLSVTGFVLFLIVVWPALLAQIMRVHWGIWLAIGIVASIRPLKRWFK